MIEIAPIRSERRDFSNYSGQIRLSGLRAQTDLRNQFVMPTDKLMQVGK